MKKIFLFSAVSCSLAFYACKKETNNITETLPPTYDTTYTGQGPAIDPVALTAAVKVGNGTSATGQIPAPSANNAIVLASDGYDNRTYYAISNRYIAIYPHTSSGTVAGYYIQINGSGSHFKVTYPEVVPPPPPRLKAAIQGTNLRDYYSDSAIVIKLPAGLKGDTFSVKYAAFDKNNNVSNSLTAYVKIITSPKASDVAAIAGKWRLVAEGNGTEWHAAQYGIDSVSYRFACINGSLEVCYTQDCGNLYVSEYYGQTALDFTFGTDNRFSIYNEYVSKTLNAHASTCDGNLIYTDNSNSSSQIAGYAYNDSSKTISLIMDNDGFVNGDHNLDSDISNLSVTTFKVKELNATTLKLDVSQAFGGAGRQAERVGDPTISPAYLLFNKQ